MSEHWKITVNRDACLSSGCRWCSECRHGRRAHDLRAGLGGEPGEPVDRIVGD
jgi:hypothetical protein